MKEWRGDTAVCTPVSVFKTYQPLAPSVPVLHFFILFSRARQTLAGFWEEEFVRILWVGFWTSFYLFSNDSNIFCSKYENKYIYKHRLLKHPDSSSSFPQSPAAHVWRPAVFQSSGHRLLLLKATLDTQTARLQDGSVMAKDHDGSWVQEFCSAFSQVVT